MKTNSGLPIDGQDLPTITHIDLVEMVNEALDKIGFKRHSVGFSFKDGLIIVSEETDLGTVLNAMEAIVLATDGRFFSVNYCICNSLRHITHEYIYVRGNKSLEQVRKKILSNEAKHITNLEIIILECRDKFLFYAQEHLKKTPPDFKKARTNFEMAERCQLALDEKK